MENELCITISDIEQLNSLADKMGWSVYVQRGNEDYIVGFIIGTEAFVDYVSEDCHG